MDNPRKRMSREDRQAQIIKAALKLFVENGYKGTTTVHIAEAAGISEVTLFRNFASKRDIFIQGVIPVLTQTLEDSLAITENESPKEALERFLVDRLTVISENHGVVRLILMENQMNQELSDIDFIETIGKMVQDGISRMGFIGTNKSFIIRLIMGSIISFLYMPESDESKIKVFAGELANTLSIMNKNLGE